MPESKVHSFIVKLWLEDQTQRKGMGGWHGHITHSPRVSGWLTQHQCQLRAHWIEEQHSYTEAYCRIERHR